MSVPDSNYSKSRDVVEGVLYKKILMLFLNYSEIQLKRDDERKRKERK